MTPPQKPHRSKQDYRTPSAFLDAVKRYLSIDAFDCDLAASPDNAVADLFLTEDLSAFDAPSWKFGNGWNWCNPPYSDIRPWVERAEYESHLGAATAMLIPASVGSNWWRDFVHNRARVLLLNGRLAFMPDKPTWLYPKDCCLLLFGSRVIDGMYDVWTWHD